MKKVVNVLILLWMMMSVGVQFNDPDGPLWMAIYGYGLLLTIMAFMGRYNTQLLLLGITGYAVGGFLIRPDTFADMMDTNEVARESIGLFIFAGCISILYLQKMMRKDKSMSVDEVVKPIE